MKAKGLLFISVLLCLTCTSSLFAENEPHKKGSYSITFDERSRLSSLAEMKKRNIGVTDSKDEYQIKDITYGVTVPNNYNPSTPMGLFVWISAGDSGKPPEQFLAPLAKNGFIYIGADKTGNDHPIRRRLGAAIDAAANMKKLYNIDPSRIFVSGNSGGGRCASYAAVIFPDVFTGGAFYVVGCDFWKDSKLIKQAKDHYFVFLTGSKDFNQPGTIVAYEAYKKEGFKHCRYSEVPDMGHTTPPSEYFEKGLVFLNSPLKEKGKTALQEGIQKVKWKKYVDALSLFEQAKGCGIEEAQAQIDAITAQVDAETAKGLKYLEEKNTAGARVLFQTIIHTYGEGISSRAKEELNKIENDPVFVNDRKAAELFLRIQKSYEAAGKAKTAESLKKLIADYPDTTSAERAKTTLKNMGL